jgi:hypothetical protein
MAGSGSAGAQIGADETAYTCKFIIIGEDRMHFK